MVSVSFDSSTAARAVAGGEQGALLARADCCGGASVFFFWKASSTTLRINSGSTFSDIAVWIYLDVVCFAIRFAIPYAEIIK